jgi:hypothetical protein
MVANDANKTIQTDGSNADTQAAIDYMTSKNQDGWVITVGSPGGVYTWTDTPAVSPFGHSYTLQGAGSGATRVRVTAGHSNFCALGINTVDNKLARITNFIFGTTGSHPAGFLYLDPPATGVGHNSFRIDHCDFVDLYVRSIQFGNTNENAGISYGLIDHCNFITNTTAASGIYIYAGNNANQWTGNMTFGTVDTITIEDCAFVNHVATVPGLPAIDSAYNGARWSARHCTFTNWVCVAHGADSAPTSTLQVEFHHNSMIADLSDYGLYCRGGCYMASDNNFGAGGFPNQCFKFANDSAGGFQKVGQGAVAGVETRLGAYFWNNIPNGNPNIGGLPAGLTLGTNVFAAAPGAGMPITSYTELVYPHPLATPMAAFDPAMTINTLLGSIVDMDAQHTTELTTTDVKYYENVMQINWPGGSRIEIRVKTMSRTPNGVRMKPVLPRVGP